MTNKQLIKFVKRQVKNGNTLQDSLLTHGVSDSQWRTILQKEGEVFSIPRRGRVATVYTKEKAKEAKRRIKTGEYLKDICADMGMDPRNFARYCRLNGIKIFTKVALKANYKRRGEGPRVYTKRKPSKKYLAIVSLLKMGFKDSTVAIKAETTQQYVSLIRKRLELAK